MLSLNDGRSQSKCCSHCTTPAPGGPVMMLPLAVIADTALDASTPVATAEVLPAIVLASRVGLPDTQTPPPEPGPGPEPPPSTTLSTTTFWTKRTSASP